MNVEFLPTSSNHLHESRIRPLSTQDFEFFVLSPTGSQSVIYTKRLWLRAQLYVPLDFILKTGYWRTNGRQCCLDKLLEAGENPLNKSALKSSMSFPKRIMELSVVFLKHGTSCFQPCKVISQDCELCCCLIQLSYCSTPKRQRGNPAARCQFYCAVCLFNICSPAGTRLRSRAFSLSLI